MGKLEANDRMVDKLFTESAAFVRILDRLFVADAGETNALDDYAYPLVIEIGHDDWEWASAFSLLNSTGNPTFEPLILFA